MNSETLRIVLIALSVGLLSGWMLNGWLIRVRGIWQKVVEEGEPLERIHLTQSGPFVKGSRLVRGGEQQFSGFVLGRVVHLKRRDTGIEALMASGFPLKVAPLVEGQVSGSLKLKLLDEGATLSGIFEPVKIAFTQQPPRLTGTTTMPARQVAYTRLVGVEHEEALMSLLPNFLPDVEGAPQRSNGRENSPKSTS